MNTKGWRIVESVSTPQCRLEVREDGSLRKVMTLDNGDTKTRNYQPPVSNVYHNVLGRPAHRFIAEVFIPNTDNKPFVNHKNGRKNDNRVENLEWATGSENAKHAFSLGLIKPPTQTIVRTKRSVAEVKMIMQQRGYSA